MSISIHVRDGQVTSVSSLDDRLVGTDVTIVVDGRGDALKRVEIECEIEKYIRHRAEAGDRKATFDLQAACAAFAAQLQDLSTIEEIGCDGLMDEIEKKSAVFDSAVTAALSTRISNNVRAIQRLGISSPPSRTRQTAR